MCQASNRACTPSYLAALWTVFNSKIRVEDVFNATFDGVQSDPCPRCGQTGRIPDGVYSFISDAAEVIDSSILRHIQAQELIDLVRRMAADPSVTREQVADAVAEKAPGLGQVLTKYLVPRSAADFYAMLTLLLTLLSLLLPHIQGDHPSGPTTEIINQVINNCVTNPPLHRSGHVPEFVPSW